MILLFILLFILLILLLLLSNFSFLFFFSFFQLALSYLENNAQRKMSMEIILLLSLPPSSSSPLFYVDKESGRLPRFPLAYERFSLLPLPSPPSKGENGNEKEREKKESDLWEREGETREKSIKSTYKMTISEAVSSFCLSRGLSIFPFPPPTGAHPFGPPVVLPEGGGGKGVQGKEGKGE